jgi:predicted TIM-barrel fold metal-dependent hydrolase
MRTYRRFFDSLELADEAKEGIAWRNAARLFKIDLGSAGQA